MTASSLPPAPSFRLVRYFALASLAVFLPVTAALLYFDRHEDELFKRVHQEQNAFFTQMQDGFVQRHDAAAPAYLLEVHEAGTVNLTRLLANVLWEKDFAPFVARAQRIPVDQCYAIDDIKDAGGKSVPPAGKQACFAAVGKQIRALPDFKALDARVSGAMQNSTVFKIKVYDLKGITVYSSEHDQIGEDRRGNAGWQNAAAGKPASALTRGSKFSMFDGVAENRDLIESYVPVLAPGSERVVAVFEVYSDVTQFLGQIKRTSSEIRELTAANRARMVSAAAANQDKVDAVGNQQFAIVLGLLTLFYCALFLIVRNGQRIIGKQDNERQRAGLALSRQKDLYDVLSQSNKAIVHLVDREALFAAVCRIAVEHGRFLFAWIALIDKVDQRLEPVARFGEDAGYIDQLNLSGDAATDTRRGLIGRTLLTGAYIISNDFLNDAAMEPWYAAARRAGVRAAAKFPIRQGGAVVGAINLYAGEPGFFTDDVVATLDEIANDVSFALDNYAREAARKQAEAALREGEDRYRQMFEVNPQPMWVYDVATLAFLAVNDAAVAHYGWSREEFLAMTIADIRPAEKVPALLGYFAQTGNDKMRTNESWKHLKKDATPIDVEITSHTIDFDGRRARIVSAHDITERKRAEEEIQRYVEQLKTAFLNIVEVATIISEMRDPYTAGHERRVAGIAVAIGTELGFDPHRRAGLRIAGQLHDIGKITIPSEILSKPGRLNAAEFMLIKGHAQASYDVLKNVEWSWPVAEIALQHHERMDGSGYPQGLKGEAILLEARILAVADVIEAMSSHRPYRPGLGIEAALAEIERGRGTVYDANVADACLRLFREKGYTIQS